MNLSFKNRIALHYLIATATLTAVVFFLIFQVVRSSVYLHLDDDLIYEAHKHTKQLTYEANVMVFKDKAEWEEREHREAEVNPVFIQVVGLRGEVMDKSPNLKEDFLAFGDSISIGDPFDALLRDRSIRQVQVPVKFDSQKKGYLLTAMSLENSLSVLTRLRNILFFTFPLVLLVLFFITRMLAAQSILPISTITQTADNITRNNLDERIDLPKNKDELFSLTTSINRLLDRLGEALEREKQFTSDASHELRTPLTVLKGTLEVLIRKPRSQSEYIEKVGDAVQEIDHMTHTVEQLLTLARVDNLGRLQDLQNLNLLVVLDEIILRNSVVLKQKNIKLNIHSEDNTEVNSDPNLLKLLLDNLLSNAIKYSNVDSEINVKLQEEDSYLICSITDQGIGIKQEDLDKIYMPFFRSDALDHKQIKGNGLGMAIVKKISQLLMLDIQISSELGNGTTITIRVPRILSQS